MKRTPGSGHSILGFSLLRQKPHSCCTLTPSHVYTLTCPMNYTPILGSHMTPLPPHSFRMTLCTSLKFTLPVPKPELLNTQVPEAQNHSDRPHPHLHLCFHLPRTPCILAPDNINLQKTPQTSYTLIPSGSYPPSIRSPQYAHIRTGFPHRYPRILSLLPIISLAHLPQTPSPGTPHLLHLHP